MDLVGERHLRITGCGQQYLNWEECGFRMHLRDSSFPKDSITNLSVYAVHSGPFLYPENMAPASCIYYIKLSQPLLKPVVVEIQHCWNVSPREKPHLSFALAAMSTGPPYQFELVDGGVFQPGSSYGILDRGGFCSLTILERVGEVVSSRVVKLDLITVVPVCCRYHDGWAGHR